MPVSIGEVIRNWDCSTNLFTLWPNSDSGEHLPYNDISDILNFLWPYRTSLKNRKAFGIPVEEKGLSWWALRELYTQRLRPPLTITFAFVATHNHFVFNRGDKVFNRTAPIIKLPSETTEESHLALIGLLNSSTACFWGRQVFFPKGGFSAGKWEERLEWDGTKLKQFPIPETKPIKLAQALDRLSQELQAHLPAQLIEQLPLSRIAINNHQAQAADLLSSIIALQEELDWQCYHLYGLTDESLQYAQDPPPIQLGQRAFEIIMARNMATGELETTWFERHRSTPCPDIPSHWPEDYQHLVERRMALIDSDPNINLIERPEYKRRWNTEPWEQQEQRALKTWLLDRLETASYWPDIQLQTTLNLANTAELDTDFMQVAERYRGTAAFDVSTLVAELVEAEAVPFLPVLRYKPDGLRKREIWERTWDLQRAEDAIDAEVEATFQRQKDETD